MKRLKLIQGLSYAVRGFSCALGVPFDIGDDFARKLLSTGRFEELQCVPAGNDEPGDGTNDGTSGWMDLFGKEPWNNRNDTVGDGENPESDMKDAAGQDIVPKAEGGSRPASQELSADGIAKLKKAELEALAAGKNIDISDCGNNGERVEKICGALGLVSMAQMGLED